MERVKGLLIFFKFLPELSLSRAVLRSDETQGCICLGLREREGIRQRPEELLRQTEAGWVQLAGTQASKEDREWLGRQDRRAGDRASPQKPRIKSIHLTD